MAKQKLGGGSVGGPAAPRPRGARTALRTPTYTPVRQPAAGSPTHPHSFIDDAVSAIGGAIGGLVNMRGPSSGPSNIKGGPFPGGVNAVTNALNSSKRK